MKTSVTSFLHASSLFHRNVFPYWQNVLGQILWLGSQFCSPL